MSETEDEYEIIALAVRKLVDFGRLTQKTESVFFLGIAYWGSPTPTDPPAKLFQQINDLPVTVRARSRGIELPRQDRSGRLVPTLADQRTGNRGYSINISIGKWRENGPMHVGAGVIWGPLAGRGFTAQALRSDAGWTLDFVHEFFS